MPSPGRAMMSSSRRSLGARVASLGLVAQASGFATDARLHGRDPGLAAREGVFSLGNAGHALVAVGLVLLVAGLGFFWAGSRVLPVIALLVVAGAVTASPFSSDPHAGDDGVAQARARGERIVPGLRHDHDRPGRPAPMSGRTRRALAAQLVDARAAALRHPTVASAQADGYRMVVPYLPLLGAHYLRDDLVAGPFATDRPAMLLYDGTSPDSGIVGLSYYLANPSAPAGFAGGGDRWHRHVGLCFDDRLVVVGGEALSQRECDDLGGHKVGGADGWMVHAWVVPGWESPDGVFSAENRSLS